MTVGEGYCMVTHCSQRDERESESEREVGVAIPGGHGEGGQDGLR